MIMFLSQALDLLRCRDPVDGQHPFSTLINRIEQTLGSSLNGVRICIKRDDAISLGSGGNKLRKPERLLDDDAKLPFLSSSSASRSRRRKTLLFQQIDIALKNQWFRQNRNFLSVSLTY